MYFGRLGIFSFSAIFAGAGVSDAKPAAFLVRGGRTGKSALLLVGRVLEIGGFCTLTFSTATVDERVFAFP
jgi:hypothetical protein